MGRPSGEGREEVAIWMTASISSLVGALITGGLVLDGDFAECAEDGREAESCVRVHVTERIEKG